MSSLSSSQADCPQQQPVRLTRLALLVHQLDGYVQSINAHESRAKELYEQLEELNRREAKQSSGSREGCSEGVANEDTASNHTVTAPGGNSNDCT